MKWGTITLMVAGILLSAFQANSQGYYYYRTNGTSSDFDYGTSGKSVLTLPRNDVLSDHQKIPFTWDFYGQPVDSYYVSDNGYITFAANPSKSYNNPVQLNGTEVPKNSIFGFWYDLQLTSTGTGSEDKVKTFTYGNGNNRIHVISWYSVSVASSQSKGFAYFSIRLYEQGGYDIVWSYANSASDIDLRGSAGCINKDGSLFTEVMNSPSREFPTIGTGNDDDVVFNFKKGPQPRYDVLVNEGDNSPMFIRNNVLLISKNNKIKVNVSNVGAVDITDLEISYQINGKDTQTVQINGLNIKKNGEEEKTVEFQPQGLELNSVNGIEWWVSKINGNDDENASNDSKQNLKTFVNKGMTTTKRPLIEEFSTAPCGWCPDGAYRLELIKQQFPKALIAQHHAGFRTDSMTIPEHTTYAYAFAKGRDNNSPFAPSGVIDRVNYISEPSLLMNRGIWATRTSQRLNFPAPVSVDVDGYARVESSKKGTERNFHIEVNVKFHDKVPKGDLRVTTFFIQDTIEKIGDGYNQRNYLNRFANHPYQGKGDPIIGYKHINVVREVLSPAWGESGVIPSDPEVGVTYSVNYDYAYPGWWGKFKNMHVVAFVSYFDQSTFNRIVLNSGMASKQELSGIGENTETQNTLKLFPNPAKNVTNVNFQLRSKSNVSLELTDMMGRKVKTVVKNRKYIAGDHSLNINVADLKPGLYLARIIIDNEPYTQQLMVTE